MNLQIRNIEFLYGVDSEISGVAIRFESNSTVDNSYLNGVVKLTQEEFATSSLDFVKLSSDVAVKIKEQVTLVLDPVVPVQE